MGFAPGATCFSFATGGAVVVLGTTGFNGATAAGFKGAARALAGAFAAAFFSAIAFSKAFMGLASDVGGLGLLAEKGIGAVVAGVFEANLLPKKGVLTSSF
jgi:hypothetical protein